jgi:hypothetical protein
MPGLGSIGRAVSGGLGRLFGGAARASAPATRGLLSAASTVPGATGHVFEGAAQAGGSGLGGGAAEWLRGAAGGVARDLFGSPGRALSELQAGTAFRPGGMFHHSNTLWTPAAPAGSGALRRAMPWVNRAFTVGLPAAEAVNALAGGGDPNKGRLENALGAIGGGLGFAYGMPAVGMLGAGYTARAGRALGEGLGSLVGRPTRQTTGYPNYRLRALAEQGEGPLAYSQERTAEELWKRAAGTPNLLPQPATSAQNTPNMKPQVPGSAPAGTGGVSTSPRAPTATVPVVATPRM